MDTRPGKSRRAWRHCEGQGVSADVVASQGMDRGYPGRGESPRFRRRVGTAPRRRHRPHPAPHVGRREAGSGREDGRGAGSDAPRAEAMRGRGGAAAVCPRPEAWTIPTACRRRG